jgi:multiple antibiotic resistance protein
LRVVAAAGPELTEPMHDFLQVFIPLFVAIDAVGLIPVFLAVTGGLDDRQRREVTFQAVASALVICLGFMFLGNQLFAFLGVRAEHFMIAGGVLLLVLSVLDIVIIGKPAMQPAEVVGVVPLGMPLIAGPATLATVLLLAGDRRYGYALTALSIAVNLAILLVALLAAPAIGRLLGLNALRAMSKLVMILLAAIAVRFIADGIAGILRAAG